MRDSRAKSPKIECSPSFNANTAKRGPTNQSKGHESAKLPGIDM